jgi:hypothetical protein
MELLIALFMTGVLTTAALSFYVAMHQQTETQYEISETQSLCRTSLYEIKKTVRMAGCQLTDHAPYEINGDSLTVYFCDTQPVDTILYFLEEFSESEYASIPQLPDGKKLFKLMKQVNSGAPTVYADFITNIGFALVGSTSMSITITAQTSRPDETYNANDGYRTFTVSTLVNMRNL